MTTPSPTPSPSSSCAALRTLVLRMAEMQCAGCATCHGRGKLKPIWSRGGDHYVVDHPCPVCGEVRAAIAAVEQEEQEQA